MDLVLGLSLTSATVGWVLVEGTTGEGAPIDRGSLDIPAADAMDANLLLDAVLTPAVLDGNRLYAVGVTCTNDATSAAVVVLDALVARGHRHVVDISDGDAATALASGVTAITDYDDVAVCIVEPHSALVAVAAGGSVAVERIDRPADGADTFELTCGVLAALDVDDRRPDAIFVVGSDDVDVIVSSFAAVTDVPVFSAAEADLALARGAALAAARSVVVRAPMVSTTRTGVLSLVLAAAVLTLIVSLSVALGLSLTPDRPADRTEIASAAIEPAPVAVSLAAPSPKAFVPGTTPKLAMTMVVAAPPPPPPEAAAPAYVSPPPAYQPPAPVYVPPPHQEPRLRDRILERIPIINRFHEPQR